MRPARCGQAIKARAVPRPDQPITKDRTRAPEAARRGPRQSTRSQPGTLIRRQLVQAHLQQNDHDVSNDRETTMTRGPSGQPTSRRDPVRTCPTTRNGLGHRISALADACSRLGTDDRPRARACRNGARASPAHVRRSRMSSCPTRAYTASFVRVGQRNARAVAKRCGGPPVIRARVGSGRAAGRRPETRAQRATVRPSLTRGCGGLWSCRVLSGEAAP